MFSEPIVSYASGIPHIITLKHVATGSKTTLAVAHGTLSRLGTAWPIT